MGEFCEIQVPALAVKQGDRWLYSFAIDGKTLPLFTTISRIHRDDNSRIGGYQRPEALAHIKAIRRYLESDGALMPNALVVAFDGRVRFKHGRPGRPRANEPSLGHLVIPLDEDIPDEEKPGWLVDGQQRSAAIREARVSGFPVFVTAFITDSVAEQRSQFILVNSTKPLPKGLIHELLPSTPEGDLPVVLLRRRFPALLSERLNYDSDSPLQGMIRTPTTVTGTIKDNSVLKMISASIEDGALYAYFDSAAGDGDAESMLALLKNYWEAVARTFPTAWRESPRRSRLVHGVGILGMGCLMDEITYCLGGECIPSRAAFEDELERLRDSCAWTDGAWTFRDGDVRRWNELENTPRDILRLTDHLLRLYRSGSGELSRKRAA